MVTVRIGGVPEHFNYPWHFAMDNKLFEKAGINLVWTDYSAGTGAMSKELRENNLDLALVLTEGIVAEIVKGNPSCILNNYVSSPLLWGIHVPTSSEIFREDEIKGKTYAISRFGSGSHLMAFVDARERGWKTENLKFTVVNNMDGARSAFKNGSAEVFLWERFTTKPLIDNGEFRLIGIRPTPWPCFMLAGSNAFVSDNKKICLKIIEIITEVCRSIKSEKNIHIDRIAERYTLKPEDIREWFSITEWNYSLETDKTMLEKVMQVLSDLNLIDKKPAVEDLICSF